MHRRWIVAGSVFLTAALSFGAGAHAADAPMLNVGGIQGSGGTIKGIVKFNGEQKKRRPIIMDADKVCTEAHPTPALAETFVFGDNDTLQNVFVYVSKGLEGKTFPTPSEPAVLDQHGCQYVPHVSGVVVGQPLIVRNSDNTLHNVNFKSQNNGGFNIGQPVKGMEETRTLSKEEIGGTAAFKCDVHPWMGAFIHVVSHPFFAVTQQDGTFTINGLPPGEYELSTWHELKAFKPDQPTYKVTVTEGGTAEVTVTYAPPSGN